MTSNALVCPAGCLSSLSCFTLNTHKSFHTVCVDSVGGAGTPGESAPIRAPASLWRCSRIMHLLRDVHPTLLSALEGIVDQVGVHSHVSKLLFLFFTFLFSYMCTCISKVPLSCFPCCNSQSLMFWVSFPCFYCHNPISHVSIVTITFPMFQFQMVWFRENWYEELLRQLNEGLIMCQTAAFDSKTDG